MEKAIPMTSSDVLKKQKRMRTIHHVNLWVEWK